MGIQVGVVSGGIGCHGVSARVSNQFDWIRETTCRHSASPPASFKCDKLRTIGSEEIPEDITQDLALPGELGISNEAPYAWELMIQEDFSDPGLFGNTVNDVKHYRTTHNRAGVVRLGDGAGVAGSRAITYLLLTVPIQKYECRLPFFQLCDTEMQFVFSFSWTTAAPLMKDAGVLCTHSRTTSGKLQVLS